MAMLNAHWDVGEGACCKDQQPRFGAPAVSIQRFVPGIATHASQGQATPLHAFNGTICS